MRELGFREGLKGTAYLRFAVNYILSQPEHPRPKLIEEVYVAVAKEFGVSKGAVEKGVRHTISRCDSSEFWSTSADVIWELVGRCREGEFNE